MKKILVLVPIMFVVFFSLFSIASADLAYQGNWDQNQVPVYCGHGTLGSDCDQLTLQNPSPVAGTATGTLSSISVYLQTDDPVAFSSSVCPNGVYPSCFYGDFGEVYVVTSPWNQNNCYAENYPKAADFTPGVWKKFTFHFPDCQINFALGDQVGYISRATGARFYGWAFAKDTNGGAYMEINNNLVPLEITSPIYGSEINKSNNPIQVSGTCPFNGQNRLALTTGDADYYGFTGNYNIDCVEGHFSGSISLLPGDYRISIVDISTRYNPQTGFYIHNNDTVKITVLDNIVPGKIPVLFIPGILGTEMKKNDSLLWPNIAMMSADVGDGFMDPLQFSTDLNPQDLGVSVGEVVKKELNYDYVASLISEFKNKDYIEDQSFFILSYDWRYGVSGKMRNGSTTVDFLREKINQILQQTGSDKVDVIAHSTGGLLLKKYIMDYPENHHINKAVFVGVPNLGAPKSIKVFLEGDNFGVPFLSDVEMQKISQNLPVTYDLSPSKEYFNKNAGYVKTVTSQGFSSDQKNLNFDEINSFLVDDHKLNATALKQAQDLHESLDNFDIRSAGVDVYSIIGCKSSTLGGIVENRDKGLVFTSTVGYSTNVTNGDGTVPMSSAGSLPVNSDNIFYAIKGDHGKLPSQDGVRQKIVNILTGSTLGTGSTIITHADLVQDNKKCALSGRLFGVYSPLSIEVVNKVTGERAGVAEDGSVQNDIPGADFEVWGEHKFVFVPNDDGQEYQINIKGTGTGTFTLKDQIISNDQPGQEQVFSNVPVTTSLSGTVTVGDTDSLSLDKNGDGTVDQTISPSAVLDPSLTQDLLPPVSTSTISGGIGGTNIAISAQDFGTPASGVLSTAYSLDNQATSTYSGPIKVTSAGQHAITFFSTDKAGNNELPQAVNFVVDIIPPEFGVNFNPLVQDFAITATDNLDPSPVVVCSQDQCSTTDKSGNTSILKFAKQALLGGIKNLLLKSVSYNSQTVSFDSNLLSIAYSLNSGKTTVLSQTELVKNQQVLNIIYNPKTSQSVITDLAKTAKPQITTVQGQKNLLLSTAKGKIMVSVK